MFDRRRFLSSGIVIGGAAVSTSCLPKSRPHLNIFQLRHFTAATRTHIGWKYGSSS
jgi:hypothetical protein